jgi:hypothetical protein
MLRVLEGFPNCVVMILIIKKFLFNCSFIGESLSCCDHCCYCGVVLFLLICLLDSWEHRVTNYGLTVVTGLASFSSVLDRLSYFRLLMHHITWHQFSL